MTSVALVVVVIRNRCCGGGAAERRSAKIYSLKFGFSDSDVSNSNYIKYW